LRGGIVAKVLKVWRDSVSVIPGHSVVSVMNAAG
jgi:hypothetical protein